jgi:hypothetical protein
MTKDKDEWGNISLPNLSDKILLNKNWNKSAATSNQWKTNPPVDKEKLKTYKLGKKENDSTRLKKSLNKLGKKRPNHAEKLTGRKRPEYSKLMKGKQAGELNPMSKTYIITEPGGKTYEIKSLKTFAENLGKPVVTAREMAMGKYSGNTCKKGAWANWIIIEKFDNK